MTARRLARSLAGGLAGRLTLVTEYIEPAFVNDVAPVVSGTTTEGQTLSVTNGSWTPTPAGYSYQWRRNGSNIGSATASTYALVAADGGQLIDCVVTADDGGTGFTSAPSNTVGPIAQADPVYSSGASISGTTAVGATLTAVTGTWSGSPSYTYQWRRNDSDIGGATSSTYLLDALDEGQLIDVVITGTNAFGAASTTTADVGPIDPEPAASYLLLMSGGGDKLKLMSGDNFLLLGAGGVPAGAILDTNGDPILDLDGQYILEV